MTSTRKRAAHQRDDCLKFDNLDGEYECSCGADEANAYIEKLEAIAENAEHLYKAIQAGMSYTNKVCFLGIALAALDGDK